MFAATGAAAAAAASLTPPTSAADSGKNSNTADDCIDRGGGLVKISRLSIQRKGASQNERKLLY